MEVASIILGVEVNERGKVSHRLSFNRKNIIIVVAVLLIFGLLLTLVGINLLTKETTNQVYVGVDIAYGDENIVFKLVDQVAGYVNLIVLGSLEVTTNDTKLTSVCDYLYQKDLYFIVFVGFGIPPRGPGPQFFQMAVERWGNKFLGAYVFDEPGGKQMDYSLTNPDKPVHAADNFTDAAQKYVYTINDALANITGYYKPTHPKLFTSDYALYWFDYLSGYDVVFGEFGSNQSRQLTVALCRGAAKVQNKDWGAIITWTYTQPPYLEDAEQLYNDMFLAYQNCAKYIVVFDSAGNTTNYKVLTKQHLDSIKRFWNYLKPNPQPSEDPAKTAYVLPRDYGYGFRGPNDKIWGLWGRDELSPKVWNDTNNLIGTYGPQFDIVYETKIYNESITLPYDKLILWNGTTISK